jgi:hypothetical protein
MLFIGAQRKYLTFNLISDDEKTSLFEKKIEKNTSILHLQKSKIG